MQDIAQLEQESGLKTAFIRKCINSIQLLTPHVHRGEKNKLLLDDNAVRIFDRIKELKEEGLALPDIKKMLDGGSETDTAKDMHDTVRPDATHEQTAAQTELFLHYQTELDTLRTERRALENQVLDLTRKTEALQGELKALPAGKTPAELRKDYETEQEKRRKAAQIMGELKATQGVFQGKRRKELLQQLEDLLS